MKIAQILLVAAAACVLAIGASAAEELVAVTLRVTAPEDTPADAAIYIAGNHESLGPWLPGRRALARSNGGWQTTLTLPDGFTLEYKITRGSWASVEKAAGGAEIGNRQLTARKGLAVSIEVASWSSEGAVVRERQRSTTTGDVRLIENFRSKVLGNDRDVAVYLPEAYLAEPNRHFPVLYLHDGQNVFDRATSAFGDEWGIDETAQRLIRARKVEPLIVVGIYTEKNRTNELSDVRSEAFNAGGQADRYAKFLVEELKPHIDASFRTKPGRAHTGVGGSSLGGLVSLYLIETQPQTFSKCAAISPALQWGDRALLQRWAADSSSLPLKRTRFWIDVGTQEATVAAAARSYREAVQELVEILRREGLRENVDYRFLIDEGAAHNEAAWNKRFPQALEFLYPAEAAK